MAKRILRAQLNPCRCNINEDVDRLITKEGLALTPSRVKELTDRGIAVNLPNANQFLQPDANSSWDIDPIFKRDATMATLWEAEQTAKNKVMSAHKKDKAKFG